MTFLSLARLDPSDDEALAAETPLFAAERSFAHEMGGPLTRAFLACLPTEWHDLPLVIDSHLVGLPPGYDPGPTQFHREAYPEYAGAAFDAANAERGTESVWCVFGTVMPELIAEPVDEATLPQLGSWKKRLVAERDEKLRDRIAAGELTVFSPVHGEVWRCSDDTYLRWRKAEEPGLHFWIRATRGSARPWANGRRNLGMKG